MISQNTVFAQDISRFMSALEEKTLTLTIMTLVTSRANTTPTKTATEFLMTYGPILVRIADL